MALAELFLKGQERKPGWSWQVVDASPNEMAPDAKDRKAWAKWAVVIEWKLDGHVIDGPGVLCVDLLSQQVAPYA